MRALACLLLFALGCGRSPMAVADRFVDYYFVEIDQGRALPLTAGLARGMLERELRDVSAIRKQLGALPADARPEVYYKRVGERSEADRTIAVYDLTIKHGQDVVRKTAQVAVRREGDGWKVIFFKVADGEAPKKPG